MFSKRQQYLKEMTGQNHHTRVSLWQNTLVSIEVPWNAWTSVLELRAEVSIWCSSTPLKNSLNHFNSTLLTKDVYFIFPGKVTWSSKKSPWLKKRGYRVCSSWSSLEKITRVSMSDIIYSVIFFRLVVDEKWEKLVNWHIFKPLSCNAKCLAVSHIREDFHC